MKKSQAGSIQENSWLSKSRKGLHNWSKRQDLAMLLAQVPDHHLINRLLIAGDCTREMFNLILERFPHARICWLNQRFDDKQFPVSDRIHKLIGTPDELPRSSKFQLIFRFSQSKDYPVSTLYPFIENGGYLILRQKRYFVHQQNNKLGYTGIKKGEVEALPQEKIDETLQKLYAELIYVGPNRSCASRLAFTIRNATQKYRVFKEIGSFTAEMLDAVDELMRSSTSRYEDRLVRKPFTYQL